MKNPFLGTGWSFPPNFNRRIKSVVMVSEINDINQSLQILLNTNLGERVMNARYGSSIQEYIFEPNSNNVSGFLRDHIETAILFFEPRIDLMNVEIRNMHKQDRIEGVLRIAIDYKVKGTNSRFNFVYDYYLNEAIGSGANV